MIISGLPLRRTLKKTAVPSQKLSNALEISENFFNKRPEKRSNKTKSILTETKTQKTIKKETTDMNASVIYCLNVPSTSESTPLFTIIPDADQSSASIKAEIDDYKRKYEDLLLKFKQSRGEVTRLSKRIQHYKMQLYIHSLKTNDKLTMAEKLLNKVLTKNQMSLFATKKKRVCGTRMKKVH